MISTMTVIKFTFMTRFRSKSFRVISVILILLLSILIHLPALIDKLSSHEAIRIGVLGGKHVDLTDKLAAFYNNQPHSDVVIVPLQDAGSASANEAIAKQQIVDKKIKGYLEFTDEAAAGFPKIIYKSEGTMEFSFKHR